METHGWKNRETRLIHIWISNDESLYLGVRELVSRYTIRSTAPWKIADALEGFFYGKAQSELTEWGNLWSDLIGGALAEVDWRTLAERLREEAEAEYNNPQG